MQCRACRHTGKLANHKSSQHGYRLRFNQGKPERKQDADYKKTLQTGAVKYPQMPLYIAVIILGACLPTPAQQGKIDNRHSAAIKDGGHYTNPAEQRCAKQTSNPDNGALPQQRTAQDRRH